MRSPFCQRTNLKGPVPIVAFPELKSSVVAPLAARLETIMILALATGILLIAQRYSLLLYKVGLSILVVATFLQIAVGNLRKDASVGRSLLFILMVLADASNGHAVLPAFVLGLVMSRHYQEHREEQKRLRVVAFAFLTPFFFIKGGMNVSLGAVAGGRVTVWF